MRAEFSEVLWLDQYHELSLSEIAELSGLSTAELEELMDYGALIPIDSHVTQPTFTAQCVVVARTANRLRRDFELDAPGVALAISLLDRVHDLERQLSELRALLPHPVR